MKIATARTGIVLAFALMAGSAAVAQDKAPYVAFTAIVEHPALDDVRKGAIEELAKLGYVDKQSLRTTFDSAQGQPANAAQIAAKLVGQRPDVIVGISTPSAQSLLAATKELPIVFSAVTDPVAAKLVADPAKPGANVTGVTDMAPVAGQVALAKQLLPSIKRLGVIYNPGETNSIALIAVLRRAAKDAGLELIESAANRTADLSAAAERLVGKVDAIYLPTDNVVASGLEAVIAIARQNRVPTVGDAGYVSRGVLVGSGFDYHELGQITGRMVAEILKGRKPGDIPVASSSNLDVSVNVGEAKRIGFELPAAVMARAKTRVQ